MTKDQTKPRYAKKAPTRGGARANAGRKKGSTTKITVESLMEQIEIHSGKSFAEVLAFNYIGAISRNDWNGVRDYDKAFMNKLIAEKVEIDLNQSEDVIEAKQLAFAEAIRQITGLKQTD